ncbi:MAG: hypothetical protein A2340_16500 [Lentisphaerae bacterium RIFOXYB12_FULL_60_10]|nr:MAG: hypothetical protein A2340_16500 [Lentisphaerae bacterium RIFOXYB12_FULL_60_10]
MTKVVEILHELKRRQGQSYRRLIPAMGLCRSNVVRWADRLEHGQVAIQSPVRAMALKNGAMLDEAIKGLRHRRHRSRGTGALWRSWRTQVSRREFARRVKAYRLDVQREQWKQLCRIVWLQAGTVWAMDPAEYGRLQWNLVGDLASRYRFDLMVAGEMPGWRIARQLKSLFDYYGAPLVLKRDNGKNLATAPVDHLLDEYGVLALTSPRYYPRYNGAIEYAQREIKATVDDLTITGTPLTTALATAPHLLNAKPRPCLAGHTACDTFLKVPRAVHETYTFNRRKEIKDWIEDQTRTIVGNTLMDRRCTYDQVRRQVIETWLLKQGLIKVVQHHNVSPHLT